MRLTITRRHNRQVSNIRNKGILEIGFPDAIHGPSYHSGMRGQLPKLEEKKYQVAHQRKRWNPYPDGKKVGGRGRGEGTNFTSRITSICEYRGKRGGRKRGLQISRNRVRKGRQLSQDMGRLMACWFQVKRMRRNHVRCTRKGSSGLRDGVGGERGSSI